MFPARYAMVQDMANHISDGYITVAEKEECFDPVGRNRVWRFVARHLEIQSATSATLELLRWSDLENIKHWFTLFEKTLGKFCIFQGNTYNMDKKGCVLGLEEKTKVLIPSSEKRRSICQLGN